MSARTPFTTLLIANRGEIALRVMRTARAMGLRTVAVYSTVDADSEHVHAADHAVWIGGALPTQSYLNIPAIVEAARRSAAHAVHPGYGFLAENPEFADACRAAGLVFVGPSAKAMRAMGHKADAKRLMQAAGVPCIPGYAGADQTDVRLAVEAQRVGYPLMIKATAGGGGRGMRLVSDASQFAAMLQAARSEARGAFGDDEVLLERAIALPRHIEIQVMADRYGHAIHLGERDCSVQRRHQKIIEETPSTAVSPELRERMGRDAVAATLAVDYEGAGTLEFLLDSDGKYWFMEMNTRLQVEHPVTEAVTGLDLVELQLRIAAGEPLPLTQAEVRFEGHAIEARLCAENPAHDFMPQSGTLALWRPSPALRVEHGLRSGAAVPPFYDSMVAKLIGRGRTRDEARRQLLAGLAETQALGVPTNQAFLQRCLAHPVFVAGGATTAFIGAHSDALLASDDPARTHAAQLVAWLLRVGANSPIANRLPAPLRFVLDGRHHTARVRTLGAGLHTVRLDDATQDTHFERVAHDGGTVRYRCDGMQSQAVCVRDGDRLLMHSAGRAWEAVDLSFAPTVRANATTGDGFLRAAMTGRVVALLAAVGDTVEAGQALLTLEAMKMEHVHCAPRAGRLVALSVAVGDQVTARQPLAEVCGP
jgi:geranyl-CoA carboxylase alpha subunit